MVTRVKVFVLRRKIWDMAYLRPRSSPKNVSFRIGKKQLPSSRTPGCLPSQHHTYMMLRRKICFILSDRLTPHKKAPCVRAPNFPTNWPRDLIQICGLHAPQIWLCSAEHSSPACCFVGDGSGSRIA